ncbi:zf-HC2 domain-containing protein [Paenibacillus sp. N1-5-1-14]|uniref:zf-HC2 domain-containing protein n=1 Tax=Paenibacillus radicibacter TaxID=2972488 RepID=UPI0021597193|nr:zf-HC2 domain-containing protein [Paenibacillus radicibacter]MCR8645944.1 zf-HC2 domain-containing protein [Paenibacillus radicibacter]
MECKEALPLMHEVLDGDATATQAWELRMHLQSCESCAKRYQALETTEALVHSMPLMAAPSGLMDQIMSALPPEKKRNTWTQWIRRHPAVSVAAVFLLVMFTSMGAMWKGDNELSVKGVDLSDVVIQGKTVTVPSGHTVDGNLIVQGGKLKIEDNAEVKGNLIVIDGSLNMASTAHISGQITQIDEMVSWVWYKMTEFFGSVGK